MSTSPLLLAARVACVAAPPIIGWAVAGRRPGSHGGVRSTQGELALSTRSPASRAERLRSRASLALTLALGAAVFAPAAILETWVKRWSGIDEGPRSAPVVALVYAFFVAAPLEQGLKVAAFAPMFRARRRATALETVSGAGAAALGFVTAHNVWYLFVREPAGVGAILRATVAVPAHVFFACAWGFALARDPMRRLGGRAFNIAWLAATVFNGVFDNIAFGRSFSALIATTPILGCAALASWFGARELLVDRPPPSRPSIARRFLPAIAPPSLQAVRAALRRTEQPVMLHWIALGALATTGILLASLAAAVVLGRRVGLDFAAVDRGDATATGTAPLVLLGAAALAAFPAAGYLVAKASAVRSVLEPAIAAALAIAGVLLLLGLAAPLAVVFAIAFAPVAFALACAGAWVGMSR